MAAAVPSRRGTPIPSRTPPMKFISSVLCDRVVQVTVRSMKMLVGYPGTPTMAVIGEILVLHRVNAFQAVFRNDGSRIVRVLAVPRVNEDDGQRIRDRMRHNIFLMSGISSMQYGHHSVKKFKNTALPSYWR